MTVGDQRTERAGSAPAVASLSPMQGLILALRVIMETGIVLGAGSCWPFSPSDTTGSSTRPAAGC
jgi:hypothetical protein